MTAEEWNRKYPIGTAVRYYPTLTGPAVETKTRSEAWTLASREVVVAIEGTAGGVSIHHVFPRAGKEG